MWRNAAPSTSTFAALESRKPVPPVVVMLRAWKVRLPVVFVSEMPPLVPPLTLVLASVPLSVVPVMSSARATVLAMLTVPENVSEPPVVSSIPAWEACAPLSVMSASRTVTPAGLVPARPPPAPSASTLRPATSVEPASVTTSTPDAVRTGLVPAANRVSPAGAPTCGAGQRDALAEQPVARGQGDAGR